MKMTRQHLRHIIRGYLIAESLSPKEREKALVAYEKKKKMPIGPYGANVSDITRAKPAISEWADILIDELEEDVPQLGNVPPEKRHRVVDEITSGVVTSLVTALGFWGPRRKMG